MRWFRIGENWPDAAFKIRSLRVRALGLLLLLLSIISAIGLNESAAQDATPAAGALTRQQSREVVPSSDGYTCVMHPEIRTLKPGKCPKCLMTLVPVTPENP